MDQILLPLLSAKDTNEKHTKCYDDLVHIFKNLESPWAVEMLDSVGKLPSGVLKGALTSTGHYAECLDVYAPLDGSGHGDFQGKYCVSSWTLNQIGKNVNLRLSVGVCVPDSCSEESINVTLKTASRVLDLYPAVKNLETNVTLESFVCKEKRKSIDAPGIFYLFVMSIFLLLALIGSLLEVFDYWGLNEVNKRINLGRSQYEGYRTVRDHKHSKNELSATFEFTALEDTDSVTPNNGILHTQHAASTVKRILLCFSVFSNGKKILDTETVEGQLLTIHAIRVFSMAWIILGHTYESILPILGNAKDYAEAMKTFTFQSIISQSHFAVDSFFIMSGFLLTYLFLNKVINIDGKIKWKYFYLHRLWRLTPPFLTAVFFYMLIFKYMGSGPFWNDDTCANRNSWWKYFLYINNFIPFNDMCLDPAWYVGNDVQFFVISPLFLYPLWKCPTFGLTILGSILIATWTTTGIISYSYDLLPMMYGITEVTDISAYRQKMLQTFDLIYDKPYCRIAPYIIGAILGYILHKTSDRKNFLTWWQQALGWIIALVCSLSAICGIYHSVMSTTSASIYNALSRSSFGIGIAWLIFVCETGHAGALRRFLSWKAFIPLSRLTYSVYLVHRILIHFCFLNYQSTVAFAHFFMITNYAGFVVLSFGVAFAFSLVFESPFLNLQKMILKSKTQ